MVRTVKNERLTIDHSVLDLVDPVKPHRDAREYLRSILERIDKVREDDIVDMKTVREMETTSNDTKKQATANYNFKQLVLRLKKIVEEVDLGSLTVPQKKNH